MKPDFIGIGAKKAASTWLHSNFKLQPDIWMPPVKELHYFDDYGRKANVFRIRKNRRKQRILKKFFKYNHYKDPNLVKWYFNFFCLPMHQLKYDSFFRMGEGKISGEFTPDYSILDISRIELIRKTNPDIKIIFCLRNPVSRALSHLRMSATKNGLRLAEKNLRRARFHDHADYAGIYTKWSTCFPEEQIKILFFDDLKNDPKGFLNSALDFVGNKVRVHNDELLLRKKNKTKFDLPKGFEKELSQRYYPLIKKQHAFFKNEHTEKWLSEVSIKLNA